jgi:phosphoglycolate phosphatase
MLQEILAEMDVAAERAIMVGDTSYDLEMAQNLNMPRIGVSYGVHSIETLQQYQPLTIAHHVQDLHHYLQSLLKVADLTES